ncbi:proline-rich protein 36 isoform X2 [Salmo trutta]|uniref:proline-rich protein 36 isoform X2 n=1 Tax=Salmo trutta TaxID=8032 RepID=UPI0011312C7C|nr:proline-rich protein 36-like isoform X2 [Salmo trutta]
MKPDGVATAAMEPMEALDADPVNEPVAMGEEPNQAAPAPQTEGVAQQGEMGQGEPHPEPAQVASTKTGNSKSAADPKAKTKAPAAKTKPGTTATIKTTTGPGSRPNTAQSRLTNGVSKPHANGVAKKTTTGAPEKTTPKRPVGTAVAPSTKTTTKVGEKKPAGTTRPTSAPAATNGVKATTGTAAKKTPAAPTNDVKSTSTAAKKPTATTKPSTAAAPKPDRPPVSKTTRPATGAPGSRPASAAARPATASTAKSSTSTAKPGTPTAKTTSTTPRPASAKAGSTTPSAGRTPTSQPSKTATPVKKDVTKSATKKPAAAPLTRTSPAKTTKPETPKSASASKPDSTPKKPAASSKAADTKKTPSKPTPSKDVSAGPKTPSTKPAGKASTPKKTVGSNTPMAVKRGPKPTTAAEPATKAGETQDAAVAAAIAAAALAAVVSMATSEEAVMAAVPEEKETVPPQASQPEQAPEAFISQLSAQLDLVPLEEPADTVSPLGTTVMSPPCSPTGPMSPVREPQNSSALLDMHVQPEPRSQNQSAMAPQSLVQEEVIFQPDPWAQNQSAMAPQSLVQEEVIFQPDSWAQNQSAMAPQSLVQEEVIFQPDPWAQNQSAMAPQSPVQEEVIFQPDSWAQNQSAMAPQSLVQEEVIFQPDSWAQNQSAMAPQSPVQEEVIFQPDSWAQNQSAMAPQSPVQEEVIFQPDPWAQNQSAMAPQNPVQEEVIFQPDPWAQNQSAMAPQSPVQEEVKIQPDEQQEDLLMPSSSAPPAFSMMSQPMNEFTSEVLVSSSQDQEEAVEKADEEINEDDDDEEEEERTVGKPTLLFDMSSSQPSEEAKPAGFGGATGWHGDDVLPGMDSEDVSGHLQGSPEISSTQHTGLLQGTQSSDALVDSSLKVSEGEGAFMGSPDVETLANDEEEDEDEDRKVCKPTSLFDMSSSQPSEEAKPAGFSGSTGWHGDALLPGMDSEDVSGHLQGSPEISSTQHTGLLQGTQSSDALVDSSLKVSEGEGAFMGSPDVETLANDEEEDEDEDRKVCKPTSLFDMSSSQPSEEAKPAGFSGSTGWHGDALLPGMDSEDVSSHLQWSPEISSTQHTGLLQGTQSFDALVDSSLKGSEGEGAFMGSPDVETLANDEEERVDVDDMDVSSERAVDHRKVCQHDDEEDDEDVEMPSEGVTESGLESCGNADEDDYTEEDRLDNLNRSPIPPSSAWGQTNPFTDPWAQPPLSSPHTASSPLSDHGAADPETPTLSSAQAWLDPSAPSLTLQSEQPSESALEEMESSAPVEASAPPGPPAVGMSQSSTLSGMALAVHSSSETSTPEELRDYDSSSGVESHSDKQQTPVPSNVQPDLEQDLGIHLERGDEEEEAETLPADEVLGAGPPTAPASAPSSPSTSADEASDMEGEMQINDPDAPVTMDDSAEFDSPASARILPALEEEVVEAPAGEGEEDGGGGTPQSANSVASYGFDCTMSNSNAHSTAESCGKSPGIFSLENEDQLPEEAKDPSLIKELTLPAAAAQSEELLGGPVDLLPLGQPGDQHHYMLGGKMDADHLEEANTLEDALRLGPQHAGEASEGQPPYYSAICDKTDSFLAGNV